MIRKSISEAQADLPALVEFVRKGGEVLVEANGVPVARLLPVLQPRAPRAARQPGALKGRIRVSADFDEVRDP
ncbi:MAG: type II toxin-antitoxin system prevent-host-death family antitoxin [Archangium sp.]|nr:type II toxin-antitoxin system prevent-host-death family antitoxin [Archangium sp.]